MAKYFSVDVHVNLDLIHVTKLLVLHVVELCWDHNIPTTIFSLCATCPGSYWISVQYKKAVKGESFTSILWLTFCAPPPSQQKSGLTSNGKKGNVRVGE
jgi:hypothetical protein